MYRPKMEISDRPANRLRRAREAAGFKTAAEFARKHNLTEVTYRSHENDTRELTLEAAKLYAAKLGVSWLSLLGEPSAGEMSYSGPSNDKVNDLLPVLGMAEGGQDGWNLFNGEPVQYIRRPDNLLGVPGAYGVYIRGSSMEPRYRPGEIAHVHPARPAAPGDYVLVQKRPENEGEPPKAVIKQLVKKTGTKLILAQHRPEKRFEVDLAEVTSIHRVVGSSEA